MILEDVWLIVDLDLFCGLIFHPVKGKHFIGPPFRPHLPESLSSEGVSQPRESDI